jgi:hypothetical protein
MICKVSDADFTLLKAFVEEKIVVECRESLKDIYSEFDQFIEEIGATTAIKKGVFKDVVIQLWVDENLHEHDRVINIKAVKAVNTGVFIEGVGLKGDAAIGNVSLIQKRRASKEAKSEKPLEK